MVKVGCESEGPSGSVDELGNSIDSFEPDHLEYIRDETPCCALGGISFLNLKILIGAQHKLSRDLCEQITIIVRLTAHGNTCELPEYVKA